MPPPPPPPPPPPSPPLLLLLRQRSATARTHWPGRGGSTRNARRESIPCASGPRGARPSCQTTVPLAPSATATSGRTSSVAVLSMADAQTLKVLGRTFDAKLPKVKDRSLDERIGLPAQSFVWTARFDEISQTRSVRSTQPLAMIAATSDSSGGLLTMTDRHEPLHSK